MARSARGCFSRSTRPPRLGEEITRLGGPTSKETILHIDLAGRDPDDGLTQIPYDKGAAFVRLLEKTVRPGGLRRVPARLLRAARVQVDHHGAVRSLFARAPSERRRGARTAHQGAGVAVSARACRTTLRFPCQTRSPASSSRRSPLRPGHPRRPSQPPRVGALRNGSTSWLASREAERRATGGPRPHVRLERPSERGSAVRLAPRRDTESLHAGHAGARTLPHFDGTTEIPSARCTKI